MSPIKILSVEDTRRYEQGPTGHFHPVPGSGSERACSRCGGTHELLLTYSDGEAPKVIGLGCALQAHLLTDSAYHRLGAAAKTLARLEAELRDGQERLTKKNAALAEIMASESPPVTFERAPGYSPGDTWALMGYARVLCHARDGFNEERQKLLLTNWRAALLRERTGEVLEAPLAEQVAALTSKLARTRSRLAELLAGNSAAGGG